MRKLAAALLLALAIGAAHAAEIPYTQAAFQQAQAADAPILVWVHATWCPTCAKQAPILAKLEQEPGARDLRVFKVDFDQQKDVVRAMGVQMQSTLIALHGKQEVGRSTGETSEAALRALASQALASRALAKPQG